MGGTHEVVWRIAEAIGQYRLLGVFFYAYMGKGSGMLCCSTLIEAVADVKIRGCLLRKNIKGGLSFQSVYIFNDRKYRRE